MKTTDRTGVEMEALTAVCAAWSLTVIDMIKVLTRMRRWPRFVSHQTGGKTGDWSRSEGR